MDKVVFVVQIIWDRSYLWNSCKTEARAYASPGEVSPWLCWAAPAPSKRVWSETILATPVEIPRACFVLRWLQVSFLYATGCLGPIHWKCQFFHHCIYDVWGYFVSSYSCHFYKSCGLCGALWIFGLVLFLVFWELCFRKSRCVWHEKSPVCIIFFYSCWRTEIQRLSGRLAPFPCRLSFIWKASRLFIFHICEPNTCERFGPCNS